VGGGSLVPVQGLCLRRRCLRSLALDSAHVWAPQLLDVTGKRFAPGVLGCSGCMVPLRCSVVCVVTLAPCISVDPYLYKVFSLSSMMFSLRSWDAKVPQEGGVRQLIHSYF
jgi:hypothetical protein